MLAADNVVAGYGADDELLKGIGLTVAKREIGFAGVRPAPTALPFMRIASRL